MIARLIVLFVILVFTLNFNREAFSTPLEGKPKACFIDSLTVYESENLIIKQLTDHVYVHISFLDTNDFGKVACNGMLVVDTMEGVIFDTPTDSISSEELLNFVSEELKSKVVALVPTHFHSDCLGGITAFEYHDIPVYVHSLTMELLTQGEIGFSKPVKEFNDKLSLNIGGRKVHAEYFGEGHTKDNIIGYFPEDKAVFGGCLIKEDGAKKGYLGDANLAEWSATVLKIKTKYPKAQIVVPGHGQWGDSDLFDYTIELFNIK
ncbi:beta-lactamase [Marivirga lumbricoides]|uniref:beta-lactamase n=1 Tax=Marivirga lumbricoides TaxID=1046115 RepID=A0ABQ1L7F7_9BACT|nr:beta-lactamase [Marivirga lumbricoides]